MTQQQPAIGVLALQGDVAEHLRALRAAGARASAVRRPAELEAVDGLVIPGGESTTIWKLAEIFELAEPLRKRPSRVLITSCDELAVGKAFGRAEKGRSFGAGLSDILDQPE